MDACLRSGAAFGLLVCGCSTAGGVQGGSLPPACTVTVTTTAAEETFEATWYYDASGRVLRATSRPFDARRGFLVVNYDRADRVRDMTFSDMAAPVESFSAGPGSEEPREQTRSEPPRRYWLELAYDHRGRLTRTAVQGADASKARYRYDASGRLSRGRTDRRRQVYRYSSDAVLFAVKSRRPGGLTQHIAVTSDTNGQIESARTTFASGRFSDRPVPDPQQVELAHDAHGHVVHARFGGVGSASKEWVYDDAGRLVRFRQRDDARDWGHSFDYDEQGRWVGQRSLAPEGARKRIAYEGQCDGVNVAPRGPTATEILGLRACVELGPATVCESGRPEPLGGIMR